MPGNGLGDRVHNFFAQDNSLQGQHQSHVPGGNWPVSNNSFWVGNQRQTDVLNSNGKSYTSQNSDIDRGQPSYPVHTKHGANFSQSNPGHDFATSQSLNEQKNMNGFMYGNQFYQTRQNEANFRTVDTNSDPRHVINSRGLSVQELQQRSGPEHQERAFDRPETSVTPGSFDLFGGQQQMNHQQSSMLQQQLMMRKMQELQRQQQFQQLDFRSQNQTNQVSPFTKQASGSQSSALVNGTPNSDALQYPWTTEQGTNWLTGGSTIQGSPSGLVFSPNIGQTQRFMDMVPKQVDQSLFGVPVSSPRVLAENQYSQMVTDRPSLLQMSTSRDSFHGNQHNFLPDQMGVQDRTSFSRQKSQAENMLGHASSQSQDRGIVNMGNLQQTNSMQRNAPPQDFLGRLDLPIQSKISHERPTTQVTSSMNEVALDPTEEKILFGSDDNIWDAFGKSPNRSGEVGNLFDNGGLLNGSPSLQSGSWSALMQSAVAETSGSDIGPQEEWSGLIFSNADNSSAKQSPSMQNDNVKKASLPDDNMRTTSALRSGSIPPSGDLNTLNVMGSNQLGYKFQNEPGQRVPTDMPQRFVQSLEEASKWSNQSPLQRSVAEMNPLYASQQPNGWNATVVPPGGDGVLDAYDTEKLPQNSQNSQLRVMQGEVAHGSSLWKSSSVSSSAIELGPVKSTGGNHLANKRILSLNEAAASIANSRNVGVGDETSPFVQNDYFLNQWKNANPIGKFQAGEGLGRMLDQVNEHNLGLNSLNSCDKEEVTKREMENCAVKENSSDSHRSNLSQHAYGDFRESGLSDAGDSRSLPPGKQKSTNQLARKVSGPRKFQYHPMGNSDEGVEPTYGLKHPSQVQGISPQNTHFGQSQFFDQVPRNSSVIEKGQPPELQKDNKRSEEEPPRGSFPGYAPNLSVPFSRSLDSYTPNEDSSPGQSMLELIHKVDQSRDHGAMMHLSSSECNVLEAEKSDGSVGRLQRTQSSVPQGFGLQLGPPSQRLHIPDVSSSSQNAQSTVNSVHTSHASAGMGEKGQQMVLTSSAHSSHYPNGETQVEVKNSRSAAPGHAGNENCLYKMPVNYHSASNSGIPYPRSQLQNRQMTRLSGEMTLSQHIDSFSANTSRSMQRGSAETVPPDSSHDIHQDNLASAGGTTQQTGPNDVQERGPAATTSPRDHLRSSQHFGMPGISRRGSSSQILHNMWTNVPTPQHAIAAQYQKVRSHFSELPLPNIVESSSAPLTQGDVDVSKVGTLSSKLSATRMNPPGVVDGEEQGLKESSGQLIASVKIDSVQKMEEPLGEASSIKNQSDDSPANSASTQNDIEAFGRSLKPNMLSNQKYALLNQMRASRDAETDPSIRFSKRMKGPDNALDVDQVNLMAGKQNEHNVIVGDSLGSSTGLPSEDSRMLSFSTPADILQRNASPHGNVASQNIVVPGLHVPQSSPSTDNTMARVEHSQVSPQMAPSWFNQYGALKNGPIYNTYKVPSLRPGEPPFSVGKSSSVLDTPNSEEKGTAVPIDAYQVGSTLQNSSPIPAANGHLSSPQSSQLNVTGQHQMILRPKKRKSATCELHPWHKEMSNGPQNLWTIRVAEADWSMAANRLPEKVEDESELIEHGLPVLRSKRRLILTTQLMQQLFIPPPATILADDASSKYESVTYALSRAVLGDACSTVPHSSDLDLPRHGMDRFSAKGIPSARNGDPRLVKVIEELMGRAKKIENDFLRLEKSASMLDVTLECQDLEKFSVINRFARFHGRGQTDNAETASIDVTTANQKPLPQRYVTALPVPRNFPDRVQCLSL